jgi:hypothetical protein
MNLSPENDLHPVFLNQFRNGKKIPLSIRLESDPNCQIASARRNLEHIFRIKLQPVVAFEKSQRVIFIDRRSQSYFVLEFRKLFNEFFVVDFILGREEPVSHFEKVMLKNSGVRFPDC